MARSALPTLDEGVRRRLGARFGDGIESWFDELTPLLAALADRWHLELGELIPRGSMSVVIRCRSRAGDPAVLKVSPDRERLANESAALAAWATRHVPAVLALDPSAGALLLEAIEPGTSLLESPAPPSLERASELLASLHASGVPDSSHPSLAQRVAYLFDSWSRPRERNPTLVELVPPELFERGRRLAMRLAEDEAAVVLLHGDLNPGNILDGGRERGLVAIDPAPCRGDAAFDAVDLVFWRADDAETIATRAELLADGTGTDAARLLAWCTAFAGMAALDLADSDSRGSSPERLRAALDLAAEAPG